MKSFALDLSAITKKAGARADSVVRKILLDLDEKLVYRSPVGDPEKWERPEYAPPGYVGGRFRANWQHGYGAAPSGQLADIDPSGNATIRRNTQAINAAPAIGLHYLVNNLPYAERLEYGHSRYQAPQGIVGLTVVEFQGVVKAAAQS